jgi:predicted NUDIX family NTP pyrophosphohydrolase
MPDPVTPLKGPRALPDAEIMRSNIDYDTDSYRSGDDDPDEINVRSFLTQAQSEGEIGGLERYRILKELGRGGMGMVLMGEDSRLRRMAAIKVMLPKFAKDPAARERFLREARAAAKINHDNVVRILQVDEVNDIPFIAMEFLKGEPLDQYLKDKGEMSIEQALRIGREMAEGLQAAHAELGEELILTAQREFEEETSVKPQPPYIPLKPVQQKGGKMVHAWAFEGDCDPNSIKSNLFTMEWPPNSGKQVEFPEIDRADFFDLDLTRIKIKAKQNELLDELESILKNA